MQFISFAAALLTSSWLVSYLEKENHLLTTFSFSAQVRVPLRYTISFTNDAVFISFIFKLGDCLKSIVITDDSLFFRSSVLERDVKITSSLVIPDKLDDSCWMMKFEPKQEVS